MSDEGTGGAPAEDKGGRASRAGTFLGVPIEVTISVGKARPLVELTRLRTMRIDISARIHADEMLTDFFMNVAAAGR